MKKASLFFKDKIEVLKLLKLSLFPYRSLLLSSFLSLSCTAFTILFIGIKLRYFIDKGFSDHNFYFINKALLWLITLSLVLATFSFIRIFSTSWLSENVIANLKSHIFSHTLSFDQTYLETAKIGDLMARFETDMTLIGTALRVSVPVALRSLLQLLGAVILLCMTSLKLTGFVVLIIPLSLMPLIFIGRHLKSSTAKVQEAQSLLSSFTHETLLALKDVQSFCRERISSQKYRVLITSYLALSSSKNLSRALAIGLVIGIVFSAITFILWLGAYDVFYGYMSFGDLAAFVFYAVVAAGSLNSLTEVGEEIGPALEALERIHSLKNLKSSLSCSPLKRKKKLKGPFTVDIKNLSFSYPSRPNLKALNNINFKIEPYHTYAIVGPSGSSKSTLFSLLQRFYDPQEGCIKLNGYDIRTLPLEDVRKIFGIVPQDPCILNASVWENIAFSRPTASSQEIYKAAQLSFVEEFVQYFPQGYHTLLGERGVRLSGGQKQRLALARAILYQAPFLLLDEATNALDAQTEAHIQTALENAFKDCTRFVIAHRLSSIIKADKILVFEKGTIIEQGTHRELLKLQGLYTRLAEQQFKEGYKADLEITG
jgi:ATP-binding cassette subfamily B protein